MERFIELHKNQLELFSIPELYWPTLYEKLTAETFDSGNTFSLLQIDYEDDIREPGDPLWRVQVNVEDGIDVTDPKQIYLIDHAWTYQIEDAKNQLKQVPPLLQRMAAMMGLVIDEEDVHKGVDGVFEEMWKYNLSYHVLNEEGKQVPVWYMMDELGTGIEHSNEPNCRVVLFIHLPQNIVYSLLFPIRDIDFAETITRNYIEKYSTSSDLMKSVLLLPIRPHSFADVSFEQNEASSDYFLTGHVEESMPVAENIEVYMNGFSIKEKFKVCTNYGLIHEHLTDPHFEIVADEDDADILWYLDHFKEYEKFSKETPNKFINQFPFEHVITVKDLLSIVCRRAIGDDALKYDEGSLETYPLWLPTTFNLRTELVQFVSYQENWQRRSNSTGNKLNDFWIVKPYNLSRGMDIHITKNIFFIIKLSQLAVPRIVQKYIVDPVLFHRNDAQIDVKFDIRYVVVVQTLKPLQVYVYKKFFLRFANKNFDLDDLDDYEKHFTVMNYSENANLHHLRCEEFLEQWSQQYPDYSWSLIEKDICNIFREVFESALKFPPPRGICPNRQSRAVYGADLMLEWRNDKAGKRYMQPKLLEINWAADCARACEYYPSFFNDIFNLLFRHEEESKFMLV